MKYARLRGHKTGSVKNYFLADFLALWVVTFCFFISLAGAAAAGTDWTAGAAGVAGAATCANAVDAIASITNANSEDFFIVNISVN